MWFTLQKANQSVPKHNHPKSLISGVYYHQVEENMGGELEIFFENNKIVYFPKKNDLIIFNSETFHSVKVYSGHNDRIAVAWDAIYTLQLMGILKTLKRKFLKVNNLFSKKLEISKENIIVTGANSGIGYQLVKTLSNFDNRWR